MRWLVKREVGYPNGPIPVQFIQLPLLPQNAAPRPGEGQRQAIGMVLGSCKVEVKGWCASQTKSVVCWLLPGMGQLHCP